MKYFFYLLLLLLPASMQAQTKAVSAKDALAKTGKLSSIIDKTGYEFTKTDGGIYITKVEGKHNKEIYIIAAESENLVILFSVVKEKAFTGISVEQYKQLLILALNLDRIKIGLDDEDETLMVRIDFSSRTLDAEELTEGLDQIGRAADKVFAITSKK